MRQHARPSLARQIDRLIAGVTFGQFDAEQRGQTIVEIDMFIEQQPAIVG